jgi:hypothetical protein
VDRPSNGCTNRTFGNIVGLADSLLILVRVARPISFQLLAGTPSHEPMRGFSHTAGFKWNTKMDACARSTVVDRRSKEERRRIARSSHPLACSQIHQPSTAVYVTGPTFASFDFTITRRRDRTRRGRLCSTRLDGAAPDGSCDATLSARRLPLSAAFNISGAMMVKT